MFSALFTMFHRLDTAHYTFWWFKRQHTGDDIRMINPNWTLGGLTVADTSCEAQPTQNFEVKIGEG